MKMLFSGGGTIIIAFALCFVTAAAADLKVAADPWCPFTCAVQAERPGLFVEVLREAMGPTVKIVYEEVAWARAVEDTRQGKYSAILGALKVDAPDFVFPELAITQQKSCFFVTPDSKWSFKDLASLQGQVLGGVNDYMYGGIVDDYIKSSPPNSKAIDLIAGINVTERLFKKLRDRRIDVMVEDETVAAYILANTAELKAFSPKQAGCMEATPLYVAFSPADKNSKANALKFSKGLKQLQSTKRLQEIFAKYGLKM